MKKKIKNLLKSYNNNFNKICKTNSLKLSYPINKDEVILLKSIFEDREYADYFPFYKNANIIDIGAHFGYFSIFAQNNTGKKSKILSIEPSTTNFITLKQNLKDNKAVNVDSINCAIGSEKGLMNLYIGNSYNHSIIKGYSLLGHNSSVEEVEVKTLEEILIEYKMDFIDFLKMDCEGAEYTILKNLPSNVWDKIKTISLEFHDLKEFGHSPEDLIDVLLKFNLKSLNTLMSEQV